MDLWSTPFYIFDHVLKDNFILVLCLRSNKQLQIKSKSQWLYQTLIQNQYKHWEVFGLVIC